MRSAQRARQRGFLLNPYRFGAAPTPGGDPHWANVSALLKFDGADGSTSIVDETGRAWTASGAAAISTTGPRFGSGCLLIPAGAASGTRVETAGGTAFQMGAGDFTMECFIRPETAALTGEPFIAAQQAADGVWTSTGSAFNFYLLNGRPTFRLHQGASAVTFSHPDSVAAGVYSFVSASRVGGTLYLALNGASASVAVSGAMNTVTIPFVVGRLGSVTSTTYAFKGRIDEFRVTRGVGRYSGSYTPPTAPFPVGPP